MWGRHNPEPIMHPSCDATFLAATLFACIMSKTGRVRSSPPLYARRVHNFVLTCTTLRTKMAQPKHPLRPWLLVSPAKFTAASCES